MSLDGDDAGVIAVALALGGVIAKLADVVARRRTAVRVDPPAAPRATVRPEDAPDFFELQRETKEHVKVTREHVEALPPEFADLKEDLRAVLRKIDAVIAELGMKEVR